MSAHKKYTWGKNLIVFWKIYKILTVKLLLKCSACFRWYSAPTLVLWGSANIMFNQNDVNTPSSILIKSNKTNSTTDNDNGDTTAIPQIIDANVIPEIIKFIIVFYFKYSNYKNLSMDTGYKLIV